MKVAAFLQLRNEEENKHLRRCLRNCSHWADEIFIYDDNSNDDSGRVYLDYTEKDHIIFGEVRSFDMEQFHKQELLLLSQKCEPDWIVWIDGDDTLDKPLTEGLRDFIEDLKYRGHDSAYLHNTNLWRSPLHRRVDTQFDLLRKVNIFENTKKFRALLSDSQCYR